MDVLELYKKLCSNAKVNFTTHHSPLSYDTTTLFCPAGMQQYKSRFTDLSRTGETIANVQTCLRLNDLALVGDGTHSIVFDMLGFFSFRGKSVAEVIAFFLDFVESCGLKLSHVTVHHDKIKEWVAWYPESITVEADEQCVWSDGNVGGYCTEFYVNDSNGVPVEIGNIVNPLGTCIDVGFGLDRLDKLVNGTNLSRQDEFKRAITSLQSAGVKPGNVKQGYVLRKLLRRLDKEGGTHESSDFLSEQEKRKLAKLRYEKLRHKHPEKSAAWWKDTHGVDLDCDD